MTSQWPSTVKGAPAAILTPEALSFVQKLQREYGPRRLELLLERADHPGFWQSVTGSQHEGEDLRDTAIREVAEETGLDALRYELKAWNLQNVFEIYPLWRHRYAAGVTHNTEHVFGLRLPHAMPVMLSPREHLRYEWLPWREAAERVLTTGDVVVLGRRDLPIREEIRIVADLAVPGRQHTRGVPGPVVSRLRWHAGERVVGEAGLEEIKGFVSAAAPARFILTHRP